MSTSHPDCNEGETCTLQLYSSVSRRISYPSADFFYIVYLDILFYAGRVYSHRPLMGRRGGGGSFKAKSKQSIDRLN